MARQDTPDFSKDLDHHFEVIYRQNLDRVYRYILSIVHLGPVAEDITAEVFLTLWKKKKSLLGYENVEGLLYKISKDLSFNYLKDLARNQKKKEDFYYYYFNQSFEHREQALRDIQLSALEQAIDQLPEKCRKVVKMKFVEGNSLKEIASELHISVNTVQNHLTKGKMLIKELLGSEMTFLVLVIMSFFNR